jgi:hypothetical protein
VQVKCRIAGTLDGTVIEEPSKLTVPEKESNSRNSLSSKNDFFSVLLALSRRQAQDKTRPDPTKHKKQSQGRQHFQKMTQK